MSTDPKMIKRLALHIRDTFAMLNQTDATFARELINTLHLENGRNPKACEQYEIMDTDDGLCARCGWDQDAHVEPEPIPAVEENDKIEYVDFEGDRRWGIVCEVDPGLTGFRAYVKPVGGGVHQWIDRTEIIGDVYTLAQQRANDALVHMSQNYGAMSGEILGVQHHLSVTNPKIEDSFWFLTAAAVAALGKFEKVKLCGAEHPSFRVKCDLAPGHEQALHQSKSVKIFWVRESWLGNRKSVRRQPGMIVGAGDELFVYLPTSQSDMSPWRRLGVHQDPQWFTTTDLLQRGNLQVDEYDLIKIEPEERES